MYYSLAAGASCSRIGRPSDSQQVARVLFSVVLILARLFDSRKIAEESLELRRRAPERSTAPHSAHRRRLEKPSKTKSRFFLADGESVRSEVPKETARTVTWPC